MDDDLALARLRTAQRVALALLLAAAAVYLAAVRNVAVYPGLAYLRAFCEAALVGGLADWFAVTALFRRPLGLPIPHTAIVPANKDRIGDALGRFVEYNFLTPDVIGAKLGQVDFAGLLARWLGDRSRAAPLARWAAGLLPATIDALDTEPARRFLREHLAGGLRRLDMGPLLADVLEGLTAAEQHQPLIEELLRLARELLHEAEPGIRERVSRNTAWLWRRVGLDARIAARIIETAHAALLEALDDPAHPWRRRFTGLLDEYARALREDPAQRERANQLKEALLAHPAFLHSFAGIWSGAAQRLRDDLARPDSAWRSALVDALVGFGTALHADQAVRSRLNAWLLMTFTDLAVARRHEVAKLIADTVRQWDARTLSDKLERAVGRDLQYIRINGTLIGGLVGVLLHAATQLLG
jgi:uncharacterized membrane-anchored protein YjiN (DUF445 family)